MMSRFPVIGVILASGLVLVGLSAYGAEKTLIFQQGRDGYTGTDDTFIQSGSPDSNHGSAVEVEWDGSDAGGRNWALFRFNDFIGDGPNQVPPNARIVKAIFRTVISNSGSSSQCSMIYNLLIPWDEDTVTFWDLFPDFGTQEDPIPGTHVTETSVEACHDPSQPGAVWSADITPLVQETVNGLPNNGFIIVPPSTATNGFGHVSSEALESWGLELGKASPFLTVETPIGTFRFEEGVNGYSGVQDTWIGNQGNRYFTNFNAGGIQIEYDSDTDIEYGLIRFDNIFGTEAYQVPPGTEITAATLNLFVVDTGGNLITVYEILPYTGTRDSVQVNTFFDETTVTYDNFVADGFFPQLGVEAADPPIGDLSASQAGYTQLDVTDSLKKWSAGQAENYGWLLEPTGGSSIAFADKEGGAGFGPPQLVVTFEVASVEDYMVY